MSKRPIRPRHHSKPSGTLFDWSFDWPTNAQSGKGQWTVPADGASVRQIGRYAWRPERFDGLHVSQTWLKNPGDSLWEVDTSRRVINSVEQGRGYLMAPGIRRSMTCWIVWKVDGWMDKGFDEYRSNDGKRGYSSRCCLRWVSIIVWYCLSFCSWNTYKVKTNNLEKKKKGKNKQANAF